MPLPSCNSVSPPFFTLCRSISVLGRVVLLCARNNHIPTYHSLPISYCSITCGYYSFGIPLRSLLSTIPFLDYVLPESSFRDKSVFILGYYLGKMEVWEKKQGNKGRPIWIFTIELILIWTVRALLKISELPTQVMGNEAVPSACMDCPIR